MQNQINLLKIPYEITSRAIIQPNDKTPLSGTSEFISYNSRKICVVNINGFIQPFYLSTGLGEKDKVPSGKWYPFFGIGNDLDDDITGSGWLNKLPSDIINTYYGSDILKSVSLALDQQIKTFPDIVPMFIGMDANNPAKKFINQSFPIVANSSRQPDRLKIVTDNVNRAKYAMSQNLKNSVELLKNNSVYFDSQQGILIFTPKTDEWLAHQALQNYFGRKLDLSAETGENKKRLFYIKPTPQELKEITGNYAKTILFEKANDLR